MTTLAAPAPNPLTARAIAPDLARGLMLLLIALANMPWHRFGVATGGTSAHQVDGSIADRVWQTIAIVAVDGRSYPLFAFLFGYGMWQLYRRQLAAGTSSRDAKRLLRRRHWWMLAFGLLHGVLLWFGDVVGAYGLLGLLTTWIFLGRRDRTLLAWVIVFVGLLLVGSAASVAANLLVPVSAESAEAELGTIEAIASIDSYPESMLARLGMWSLLLGTQVLGLVMPAAVLLAVLAARRGILEEPGRHRRLLARVALIGVPVSWAGAAPQALAFLGVIDQPPGTFFLLHTLTGLAGGLGYAASFALVAARWQERGLGVVGRALTAVGKRSLSCYLLHSVLFVPVFSAWGLGLGGVLSEWQGALYAVGVWLVTLLVAAGLEAAGRRGPAEALLRRLSYPRGASIAPTPMRS